MLPNMTTKETKLIPKDIVFVTISVGVVQQQSSSPRINLFTVSELIKRCKRIAFGNYEIFINTYSNESISNTLDEEINYILI